MSCAIVTGRTWLRVMKDVASYARLPTFERGSFEARQKWMRIAVNRDKMKKAGKSAVTGV